MKIAKWVFGFGAVCSIFYTPALAAGLFFNEAFDDNGDGVRYQLSSRFNDLANNNIFDVTSEAAHPNGGGTYTGYSGTGFFASEDTDDNSSTAINLGNVGNRGNDIQTIEFSGIEIAGRSNLFFDALFAAGAMPPEYDIDDFVHVEARIDGGEYQLILAFESTDSQVDCHPLAEDTDFDGRGDGISLGLEFQRFTKSIIGTGSLLDIRIRIRGDAGFESIALDDLNLRSDPLEIDVISVNRVTPNPSAASLVEWDITFGDMVNNLSVDNLSLIDVDDSIVGESIAYVTAQDEGMVWRVGANTGTGDGRLQVAVMNDLGVTPTLGNVPYLIGEIVDVVKTGPGISLGPPSVSATASGPVSYTVSYSGAASVTLASADILMGSTGTATGTVTITGTGMEERTVTVDNLTGDGTFWFWVAAGTAADGLGGSAAASGPSAAFEVDNTPPTVQISGPSVDATDKGPVSYTVTYEGADTVTLSASDVVLHATGSADGTIAISGAGSTTRLITVSDLSGNGSIGISLASGTASDGVGNTAIAGGMSDSFLVANVETGSVMVLCEDFEDDGANTRYTLSQQFNNLAENNIFDQTTNLAHASAGTYTGQNGRGIFAVEDTDDLTASMKEQSITFDIDISGRTNLQFLGLFAAGGINQYDPSDHITVTAQIDGGSVLPLLRFESTSGVVAGQPLALDANGDGVGEGAVLGLGFLPFSAPIVGGGDVLQLVITVWADAGPESVAFDGLKVMAESMGLPEIAVHDGSSVNNAEILNGGTAMNFGAVSLIGGYVDRVYTLSNVDGLDTLMITNISFAGGAASDFSLTDGFPTSILGGCTDNFVVRFSPSDIGLRSTTLRIESNDSDEQAFVVTLMGDGDTTAPEIAIHDGPTTADPLVYDRVEFGNAIMEGGFVDRVFNIDNSLGDAALSIFEISIIDGHVGDFTVLDAPATVPAGQSDTFSVRFDPTVEDVRVALLTIQSSDEDEGTLQITLLGAGREGDVLFCEEFEDDGSGSRYGLSSRFNALADDDIFDQTFDVSHAEEGAYSGFSMAGIFAAEDTDSPLGSSSLEQTIVFSTNITGRSAMVFSGLFAAGGGSTYDTTDRIMVDAQIDGGTIQNLLQFESASASVDSQLLLQDTDFDGVGDGISLGLSFQEFSAPIAGTGDWLTLFIRIAADSGTESLAIDRIKVSAKRPLPPELRNVVSTGTSVPAVTLSGEVNPQGTDTTVYFEYGLNVGYGSVTPGQAVGAGESFLAVSDQIPRYTWQNAAPDAPWSALGMSANGMTMIGVAKLFPNVDRVWITGDGGANWSSINGDAQLDANDGWWSDAASSSDGTTLILANDGFNIGNYLYVSQDSGASWQKRMTDTARRWAAVDSSADGMKLVAVDKGLPEAPGGKIYVSSNGGVDWTAQADDRIWNDVASSAMGDFLVAVSGSTTGRVFTSSDSGVSWEEQPGSPVGEWQSVACSANGKRVVAALRNGPLYTSSDNGVTWTQRASTRIWASVASSDDGLKLVAASETPAGILTSTDGGKHWLTEDDSLGWSATAMSADGSLVAGAVRNGGIYVRNVMPVNAPLTWGTTYHYRMVATSSVGVVYGEDQTFTTEIPDTFYHVVSNGVDSVIVYFREHSVRGTNFNVLVQDELGAFSPYTVGAPRTYLGEVEGYPGAIACGLIRSDGRVFSRISFEDGVEWYSAGGQARVKGTPGGVIWPSIMPPEGGAGSDIYIAEVGADADSFYLDAFGGIDSSLEMIEYSVIAANMIYLRDVGIEHHLGRVILRSSDVSDPYNFVLDPNRNFLDVFDEVGRQWKEVLPPGLEDMVMFVSPRGYGGWGSLGDVGAPAISTSKPLEAFEEGDVSNIWRHEAGHNWSAQHFEGGTQTEDQVGVGPEWRTIMSGNDLSRFSVSEGAVIIAFRDSIKAKLDNRGSFDLPLPPRASMDRHYFLDGLIQTYDVLANDHDGNGEAISLLSFEPVSALGGTLARSSGTGPGGRDEILYQAPVGGMGGSDDHFTYRIVDTSGQEALGNVIVRDVTPVVVAGPADYSLSTNGVEVILADIGGKDDDLVVVTFGEAILVSSSNRVFTADGVNFSTSLALSVGEGQTLNFRCAGSDTIYFDTASSMLPTLSVNGGTTDDSITLGGTILLKPGVHLDVNLQDDAASPGLDRITLADNARICATGNSMIVLKASRDVEVASGASVETEDGNIIIEANQQLNASSGNFSGVRVMGPASVSPPDGSCSGSCSCGAIGALAARGNGGIMIMGRGGDDPGGDQPGVVVGGTIHGGNGSGVTVVGQGGGSAGWLNAGVFVTGQIVSEDATISVSGFGGEQGSDFNIGVRMPFGGNIISGGSGDVQVVGAGGGSTASGNYGIELGGGATISSSGGNLALEAASGTGNEPGLNALNSWLIKSESTNGQIMVNADLFRLNGGLIEGQVGFGAGNRMIVNIAGADNYDRLAVNGTIDLTGVQLNARLFYSPGPADSFLLVDNQGVSAVEGTFEGYPERSGYGLGDRLRSLTYQGGDGNDVELGMGSVVEPLDIVPMGDGMIRLSFEKTVGLTLTVYGSTDLMRPLEEWTNLGPLVETPSGSGVYELIVPGAPDELKSFYRLTSP